MRLVGHDGSIERRMCDGIIQSTWKSAATNSSRIAPRRSPASVEVTLQPDEVPARQARASRAHATLVMEAGVATDASALRWRDHRRSWVKPRN
jgi:hypothetical protein